jgi:IS605 OrfB family transposase
MRATAVIKLKIPKDTSISDTFVEFNKAIKIAFKYRRLGGLKSIHDKCYKIIRKETRLPSQLACKAIRIVAQNRKAKTIGTIPIRYDIRNYWFKFNEGLISISTTNGRKKIKINIPKYFVKYVDWTTSGADIVRNGKDYFIHIFVAKDITPRHGSHTVGVDVGINKLAVTSDRQFFTGVETQLKRMIDLKARLQSKGTKSARRHLKKLKGRQKRFMRSVNHNISRNIVNSCDGTIVMENLKGIRNKNRGKKVNGMLGRWSFYQLQSFIEYKAIQKGLTVSYVSPVNTSKTCSKCNSIDTVRKSGYFHCNTCNHSLDADFNAALNIADLYGNCDRATVNLPIVSI